MLAELVKSVNSDIAALEETIDRADVAIEYIYNQYLIEKAQDELNTITEAVDLDHPEGKASEGLIGKAARVTKSVVKSLIEAIKAIFAKIRAAIEDAKFKHMMKKAENVANKNAKVKNKSVKAYDPSGELKITAKYKDFLNKMEAKLKAGKVNGVSDEVKSESEKYHKAITAAKVAAVVTVTVGAAIVMVNKFSDKFSTSSEKEFVKDIEDMDAKEFDNEFQYAHNLIKNEYARAKKDEASALSRAITDAIKAVKEGIIGFTEIPINDDTGKDMVKKAMESSYEDIDDITDSIIREAEDNLLENDTDKLVKEFKDSDLTPEQYLDILTEMYGDRILVKEEEAINESVEVEDTYDYESSVAEFLVASALNK